MGVGVDVGAWCGDGAGVGAEAGEGDEPEDECGEHFFFSRWWGFFTVEIEVGGGSAT